MNKFNENIPSHCFPLESVNLPQIIYMLYNDNLSVHDNCKSYAEKGKADKENCNAWGLSVWTTKEAINHANDLFPSWFRKRKIVKAEVNSHDGCLKHTPTYNQPDHFTLWLAINSSFRNNLQNAPEMVAQ